MMDDNDNDEKNDINSIPAVDFRHELPGFLA